MDQTLLIAASIVTVLAFIYMLIFGQRGLIDWLERRRQATSTTSPEKPVPDMSPPDQATTTHPPADMSTPPGSVESSASHLSSTRLGPAPGALQEMTTMDRAAQEFIQHVAPDIEAKLAGGLLTANEDIARALPYMALARKGINRELLCQLTGWSEEKGEQVLDGLRRFPFVKAKPDTDWLILNDDMYDLLDRRIWNQLTSERKDGCKIILDFYQRRIARTKEPQRQDLLEQLYYQFLADPREGYAEYTRLSDGALYDQDASFDMRLRDEMLRFCTWYPERVKSHGLTREFIDYDAAVRWVKHHRFNRDYDKADQVAEKVKQGRGIDPASNADFRLACADLDVNHAIVLIYKGQTDPGVAMLRAVIADLEGKPELDTPTHEGRVDSFYTRRRNLVLGLAHNNLGYAYWMNWRRYRAALEEFSSALPYFLASNLEEEIANASDNMGRVYAQLGDRTRAELLVRDSLELRRRLGRELRISHSLNSQILIRSFFGDPHGAYHLSEQRLQTSECLAAQRALGAQREIGAATISLGRSLRQLGALWRTGMYESKECDEFLSQAAGHLHQAIEIFAPHAIDEPIRLIEAYNELGCTYREQASRSNTMDPDKLLALAEEMAIESLNEAIRRARVREYWVQYVDSYEDLAQVYFQAGHLDEAENCLKSAEEAVPDAYKIREGLGLPDIPPQECSEEFWRQMGKIKLMRGHLAFGRELYGKGKMPRPVLEQALRHYAFAAAYFERYSGRARELHIAVERLYDNFKCCSHQDLEYARDRALPAIALRYHLDAAQLSEFFQDTLGLALQTRS